MKRQQTQSAALPENMQDISVTVAGDDRPYLLQVPTNYDGGDPLPLVLFFHGGGGDRYRHYDFEEKAESAGFAVAFLNGASKLPSGRLATWNAGECCGYARDSDSDDVGYVKAVIEDIKNRVNIDENRIYATGMSNGGMFSYRLACDMSGTFAAIAPVAGSDTTTSCNPTAPVSVLHIHAKDDDALPFDGGIGSLLSDRGLENVATEFAPVADTIEKWRTYNDITGPMTTILSVEGATCEASANAETGAEVMLCVTETGNHSWPGWAASEEFKTSRGITPSTAIDANDVIWDFFSRHSKTEAGF